MIQNKSDGASANSLNKMTGEEEKKKNLDKCSILLKQDTTNTFKVGVDFIFEFMVESYGEINNSNATT